MSDTKRTRNLTPLYCLHQAAYFFAMAGTSAFAVTYLMTLGFDAAMIGVILASTNLLSCTLQPIIGSYVDKHSISMLHRIVPAFLIAAMAGFGAVELLHLHRFFTGLLYIAGSLSFSITIPLCNALCAYYAQNGWQINYAAGSGVGSLSFSFASLGFGYLIAYVGPSAMIFIVLVCLALQLVIVRRYPKVHDDRPAHSAAAQDSSSLSMAGFIRRYRMFMLTMLGIVLLSACHAMAENYLIQVFERIGGGSEDVGITLFLACITAAPFMLLFERIQKRISIVVLIRLSGVFYAAKALLLVWSPSIPFVYMVGLLQTFTYAFMYPSLYYLALARIAPRDMAKGQAIAASSFVLGMAIGNSLGGIVMEAAGLSVMLTLAAGIAAAGTLLINLAIVRRDIRE